MSRAVLAALALAACGRSPASGVAVLGEPGAEPRRALAYRPTGAPLPTVRFTLDSPAMSLALRVTQDPGAAPDALHFHYAVTAIHPPRPNENVEKHYLAVTGTVAADEHGRATVRTEGEELRPSPTALLAGTIVPLPSEPVGVGARWHVETKDPDAGTTEVADYTLTALAADQATITWIDTLPVVETRMHTDLGAFTSRGTATIHFDDVVPVAAQVAQAWAIGSDAPITSTAVTLTRE